MGRIRDGNDSPPKSNLIQDSEGNEDNRYPVPDSNKTKINDTKEPNDVHKNTFKEEMLQVITENFMDMILDMVNQNVQRQSRNFKTPKIKNKRRHGNK
jgi:hypothetical protein